MNISVFLKCFRVSLFEPTGRMGLNDLEDLTSE